MSLGKFVIRVVSIALVTLMGASVFASAADARIWRRGGQANAVVDVSICSDGFSASYFDSPVGDGDGFILPEGVVVEVLDTAGTSMGTLPLAPIPTGTADNVSDSGTTAFETSLAVGTSVLVRFQTPGSSSYWGVSDDADPSGDFFFDAGAPESVGDCLLFDSDGDGVTDIDDNCVDDANSDQADADGDGIGTACDDDEDTNDFSSFYRFLRWLLRWFWWLFH
jgi:hypothetical protein